ncbi:MAG: YhcH/YjgK/YiaL family protein [Armatimonadetes bacterium]|nr:YhcH/YjgK/YiaL family protein [Armatimonadota bacterium]
MVLDTLTNAQRYLALNPYFPQAFAFLRRDDLARLEDGRYEIDGGKVYAIVARGPGRGHEGAVGEAHREYIDIQCCLAGTDEIGYLPLAHCRKPQADYDPTKDVQLFDDEPTTWVKCPAGSFVILFPEDAHAPLGAEGPLHKVVVKVAVR